MSQRRVFGIFAHVDAGKTTLSERILYQCGAIRTMGSVDGGDTQLDSDPMERRRGITVYADQASFVHGGRAYTLIDTPGHADFLAEAERSMSVLDAAVLLADASEGIRAHTVQLKRMADRMGVPTLLFVNKCDLPQADPERTLRQAASRMGVEVLPLPADRDRLAELDEAFLELWDAGRDGPEDRDAALKRVFAARTALPVLTGSAATGDGVEALLDALDLLMTEDASDREPTLQVYRVRRDGKGNRVTCLRVSGCSLRARDAVTYGDGAVEKIHEIRAVQGGRQERLEEARDGDCVGVTGLERTRCGDRFVLRDGTFAPAEPFAFRLRPLLTSSVSAPSDIAPQKLLEALRTLEEEDGTLSIAFNPENSEILAGVMGGIQIEVLTDRLAREFGIQAAFSPPTAQYRETLRAPVMGYGHYEPLRHYAEVNLRLEPLPRGSGIRFESECHVDRLALNWQRLIESHVFDRVHRGTLIGAPLTDVKVVLVDGRAHIKHTEGGDFREATHRAIRQGLMSAEMELLEPYCAFEAIVPGDCVGRVLSGITGRAGSFQAPETLADGSARIAGEGPAGAFADFELFLRAQTRGEGGTVIRAVGDRPCHDRDAVIQARGYDPLTDAAQPSYSVFCSHGAGYAVPWNEAPAMMHCPKDH